MAHQKDVRFFATHHNFATELKKRINITRNLLFLLPKSLRNLLGGNFDPLDLITCDPEKKALARKYVANIAKLMAKENKARIIRNLDTASKHLPSDRQFTVLGKELNYFSLCRFVLN